MPKTKVFADEVGTKKVVYGDVEFTIKPLSAEDSAKLSEDMYEVDARTGEVNVKVGNPLKRLEAILVDWNITVADEDGKEKKVPINSKNIKRLRDPVVNKILQASRELEEIPEEEAKK